MEDEKEFISEKGDLDQAEIGIDQIPLALEKDDDMKDEESILEKPSNSATALENNKCCLCGEIFQDNQELMEHCLEKHNIKNDSIIFSTLQCMICLTYFEKLSDLETHRSCTICLLSFETESDLESHQLTHDEPTELTSDKEIDFNLVKTESDPEQIVEETSQNSEPIVKSEIKKSTNPNIRKRLPYWCCQCPFRSDLMSELKNHFNENHSDKKKINPYPSKLSCRWCLEEFDTKEEKIKHPRKVRRNDLICSKCGEIFRNLNQLNTHSDNEHPGWQIYECDECDKKFKKLISYRSHKYMHHHDKNVFDCKYCGKIFHRRKAIEEHLNAHKGITPYVCKLCPSKFPRSAGLRAHMRIHTKERPFKCKFCDLTYSHFTDVKRHMFKHTQNWPFFCENCGKGFAKRQTLETHKRTHLPIAERIAIQRRRAEERAKN